MTSPSAVSSVGPTLWNEFLAMEMEATRAAVAGTRPELYEINEVGI